MSGHRVAPSAKTRFYTATKFAVTALLEGKKSQKIEGWVKDKTRDG